MSKKLVVAAATAAGVVGLGSAATAATLGLTSLGDASGSTSTAGTVVSDVSEGTAGGATADFARDTLGIAEGNVPQRLAALKQGLAAGDLGLSRERLVAEADGLATTARDLSRRVGTRSEGLPAGTLQRAEALQGNLQQAATKLRAVADGQAGAGAVQERFASGVGRLQAGLTQMRQMDAEDALSAGGAGDVLEDRVLETSVADLRSQLGSLPLG